MSIELQYAITVIETIDDIATDENKVEGSAQLALDSIHKIIENWKRASS